MRSILPHTPQETLTPEGFFRENAEQTTEGAHGASQHTSKNEWTVSRTETMYSATCPRQTRHVPERRN